MDIDIGRREIDVPPRDFPTPSSVTTIAHTRAMPRPRVVNDLRLKNCNQGRQDTSALFTPAFQS